MLTSGTKVAYEDWLVGEVTLTEVLGSRVDGAGVQWAECTNGEDYPFEVLIAADGYVLPAGLKLAG